MPLRLEVSALGDSGSRRVFRYEFDADRAQILLGRRGGVDVLLPDARVSLVHARIERRKGAYYLVDDGSTNGTRLNGTVVATGLRQPLREGDRITIGDYALQVSIPSSHAGTEARPESSLSMARGMVRDLLERLGPGEAQPSLRVLDGPQTGVMLTIGDVGRTYILGRAAGNDLRLDDVDMWREHAALERDELGVTIRSGGTHAVAVNGEHVTNARQLHDGDTVTLGATSMRYHDPAEVYLRKLEESEPNAPDPSSMSRPIAVSRPPEMALIVLGVLVALAAIGGIVYVLVW
ncbi:MAG TPA: FHA domain-containing protein [Polyangia bacterium]|nr:FHA domain-containing protein [Polyangia bacterium]